MKMHRFYIGEMKIEKDFWIHDKTLVHQWTKVLRFKPDRKIVLFNDNQEQALYKIADFRGQGIRVVRLEILDPASPRQDVYLCFSLLKKDKNDWVLQKATELGVTQFIPLMCDRTEKVGFNEERARRIVTEATEQCGRTDIPVIHEPQSVESALKDLKNVKVLIAEQGALHLLSTNPQPQQAVLVGPEGGWSDAEKQIFMDKKLDKLALGQFTLRAETAAITAAALLGHYSSAESLR